VKQSKDGNTVTISELPIGKWTSSYKAVLEDMASSKDTFIEDFKENHTDTTVHFTVLCKADTLTTEAEAGGGLGGLVGLAKKYKVEGSLCADNMHLFDVDSRIAKYDRYLP
jgi:DNA topoisomerase-2